MLFDANIQVANIEYFPQEEGHLQVVLHLAISLPTGNGSMPIPAGVLRFGMTKEGAIDKFEEALAIAKDLPDTEKPSDLIVASSLEGIDDAVKMDQSLKVK